MPSPWTIRLIALFLYNADEPLVSDHPQPVLNTGQSIRVEPSKPAIQPSAVDGSESNLLSLASSGAKLFLRGVRESADAFGPLKAVAGGLCFILENCEVWTPCIVDYLRCSWVHKRTKANKQSIETLAPRIDALAESLRAPVPKGDIREQSRRKVLERSVYAFRYRVLTLTRGSPGN